MKKEMSDSLAKTRGFKPYSDKSIDMAYQDCMDIILVIKENKYMFIWYLNDKYVLKSPLFEDFSDNDGFKKELDLFRDLVMKLKYEDEL